MSRRPAPMPGASDAAIGRIPATTRDERRSAAVTVTETAMRDGWIDDLRLVLDMLDLIEKSA